MLIDIPDSGGKPLEAKVEVEDGAIILHSRGGAFGKANLRNPQYRQALRVILDRLQSAGAKLSGVWIDSRVAQTWPELYRRVLAPEESEMPTEQLVTLIGQRGAAKGRADGAAGHGNSTKRLRIGVPSLSALQLGALFASVIQQPPLRISAATQRLVEAWMIDDAIKAFIIGATHKFNSSRDYDLLLPTGKRLPPKAIFGIALEKVIGRPATPSDFSAGWGEPCFDIIESAGYPIVPKAEGAEPVLPEIDEERAWAEGSPKMVKHIRRERAPGLARMKKRWFVQQHGHLFCERCNLIPASALGPFGDACIEVHHAAIAIAQMSGENVTRLADLQCLCANCHRIVHREQLQSATSANMAVALHAAVI